MTVVNADLSQSLLKKQQTDVWTTDGQKGTFCICRDIFQLFGCLHCLQPTQEGRNQNPKKDMIAGGPPSWLLIERARVSNFDIQYLSPKTLKNKSDKNSAYCLLLTAYCLLIG